MNWLTGILGAFLPKINITGLNPVWAIVLTVVVGALCFGLGWCSKPNAPTPPPIHTIDTVHTTMVEHVVDSTASREADSLRTWIQTHAPHPPATLDNAECNHAIEVRDSVIGDLSRSWKDVVKLSATDPTGLRVEATLSISVEPVSKRLGVVARLDTIQCPALAPQITFEGYSLTTLLLVGSLSALVALIAGLIL